MYCISDFILPLLDCNIIEFYFPYISMDWSVFFFFLTVLEDSN